MPQYKVFVEYRGKADIVIEADSKDDAIGKAIEEIIDVNLHVYDAKAKEISGEVK